MNTPSVSVVPEIASASKGVEKLLPIANELKCTNELSSLVEMVENDKPPYVRQIIEYEKNNDFKDIIKLYINELEKELNVEQVR